VLGRGYDSPPHHPHCSTPQMKFGALTAATLRKKYEIHNPETFLLLKTKCLGFAKYFGKFPYFWCLD
jgi:hypothetical protein